VVNARLIGSEQLYPRSMAVWAFWTTTSLPRPYDSVGSGTNGHLRKRLGSEVPCTEKDKLLFAACTTITVGDGQKIAFWNSAWLIGQRPKDLAPLLFMKTRHRRRSLAEALHDSRWIRDLNIHEGFTTAHLLQLLNLWILISPTQLQQ
jgi:hypothetical protein